MTAGAGVSEEQPPKGKGPDTLHFEGDMPPAEFQALGHDVIDWAARYLETIHARPVVPSVEPGAIARRLGRSPPRSGEDMERILAEARDIIVPGITHWNHPSFFAYFAITGSGPGVLGELMASALNVNQMIWASSPAATELEDVATDWLRQFLGIPEGFHGTINDTASLSTFHALVAARDHALPGAREAGLVGGPVPRVYTSPEANSSVAKAILAMSFGRRGVVEIPTDAAKAMRPDALRDQIQRDISEGMKPVAIVATIGTTSTAAVDPMDALVEVARDTGTWLHVDAAYAGPAAALPELREAFDGWGEADSIVVNPHKWLFTPVDCSVLFCRRTDALRRAFTLTPVYLESRKRQVTNLMEHGLALGRRFRSLKLWFVMRYFGVEGLVSRIRFHIGLAQELAREVDETSDWELWRPVGFSLVVLRHVQEGEATDVTNRRNRRIAEVLEKSGKGFVSVTELDGDIWIRVAIGNLKTDRSHVMDLWADLQTAAGATTRGA